MSNIQASVTQQADNMDRHKIIAFIGGIFNTKRVTFPDKVSIEIRNSMNYDGEELFICDVAFAATGPTCRGTEQ